MALAAVAALLAGCPRSPEPLPPPTPEPPAATPTPAPSPSPTPTPRPSPTPRPGAPPPQTPAEKAEARRAGARLLEFQRRGALRLLHDDRDTRYLRQLAAQGYYRSPDGQRTCAPSPRLLRAFVRLAETSAPGKPLVVLSLYRPPTTLRPRSAHGRGEAIDISAFGGHWFDARRPGECVKGTLAVAKALPAGGAYRLGLPKPPGTDPRGLEPAPDRGRPWPFFPPPLPRRTALFGRYVVVAPKVDEETGGIVYDERRGYWAPEVARWANEHAAPASEVTSPQVRAALSAARRRGAEVHMLFPDAADHLHLDVVPPRGR